MMMNGREVVVIDSELFSQILDEIQLLKMKLSQLTEVIEVKYMCLNIRTPNIFAVNFLKLKHKRFWNGVMPKKGQIKG